MDNYLDIDNLNLVEGDIIATKLVLFNEWQIHKIIDYTYLINYNATATNRFFRETNINNNIFKISQYNYSETSRSKTKFYINHEGNIFSKYMKYLGSLRYFYNVNELDRYNSIEYKVNILVRRATLKEAIKYRL